MKITINGVEITLKFDFGMIFILGEMWGCEGPFAVNKKFIDAAAPFLELWQKYAQNPDIEKLSVEGVSFEIPFSSIKVFTDVVSAAAKNQKKAVTLDEAETANFLFTNLEVLGQIVALFLGTLPYPKSGGKQNPAVTTPETIQDPL